MDSTEYINKIKKLEDDNKSLQEQLEKYSNPQKTYYEKNKAIINEKANERLKKIAEENPDKIKEYAKKAYLKQKEKKKQKELINENI
jgi:hypothetical protein